MDNRIQLTPERAAAVLGVGATIVNTCTLEDTFNILEQVEAAARGNVRLNLLKELATDEILEMLVAAMNPYITYGVKRFKEPTTFRNEWIDWEEVTFILNQLATRTLTGNEAVEVVENLLSSGTPTISKWLARIIRQDLRIDMGASEVNSVFPGLIPVFKVALATDFRKLKEKELKGLWAVQPKMDGGRCIAYLPKDGGPVALLSRTGKTWENFESIREELQRFNENNPSNLDRYLDGEVISRNSLGAIDFQGIQATMHAKKRGTEVGNLEYHIFDGAYADEWENPTFPYIQRLANASNWIASSGDLFNGAIFESELPTTTLLNRPELHASVVVHYTDFKKLVDETQYKFRQQVETHHQKLLIVPTHLIENPTETHLETISAAYVEQGFEGAMLRRADKPVAMKRSKDLIKVKLFQEDEFECVDTYEGEGKYQGSLGGITCVTKDGVRFGVGSGFSDGERDTIWKNFDPRGKLITVRYFRFTNDGVPYLPTFRAIRPEQDIVS